MCNLKSAIEEPPKDIIVVDEQLVSAFKPTCSKTYNLKVMPINSKICKIIITIKFCTCEKFQKHL